jgi:signal transduction histidine kinase
MGGNAGGATDAVARGSRVRRLRRRVTPPWSVRTYMVGVILGVVVPLLAFSAYLVLRSAAHEQEVLASSVRERSHAEAAAIDQELNLLRASLFILAGSTSLQTGNLAAFHAQASGLANEKGVNVVLTDPAGQEIVNTRVPYGQQLPAVNDPTPIDRVAQTGQPYISDIIQGAVAKEPIITINVPVFRNDRLTYVVSLDIAPKLPLILAELDLPPDWVAAIMDRRGRTVARNREAARFIGQMVHEAAIERFNTEDSGWFPGVSREGVPIYNAFAHIRSAGWVIDIGIPDETLYAPVRHSTLVLLLLGGTVVCIALGVASFIGDRIARPIRALVNYAVAVGRGERLPLHVTGVNEIDAVAQSLHDASEQLHRSAFARDQAARALAVANEERTQLLHKTVASQEAERKRIARELHDSLGQYLTALRLGLDAIEPVCTRDSCAQRRVEQLKCLTEELGREFIRMAWELRPAALDELGLKNAVSHYLEEWAERSGLQIDLAVTLDRRLPPAVETALFRVLQEAITNVVKHSGASEVGVILEMAHGEVRLIVEDNGRGFGGNEEAGVGLDTKHLGLLGARERLALVNGRLEIESSPQGGATVYACVPIKEEMDA